MRRYQVFLIMSTIVLLSFTSLGSIIAQEELTEIVKMISPSTILILTYDGEGNPIGQGSGFFISQNGEVITNRHVILNTAFAEIKTLQGDIYPITHIIAEDKEGDIIRVLVDIPQEKVKPLMLSVSIPEAGERILVIGNPLGLERTVADGIVSAVRDVPGFGRIFQITAPISPGSSGSPVVNMKGEVIGIATFQMIEGQNLNFAIPGERIAKLEMNREETLTEWQLQIAEERTVSAEGLFYSGLVSVWKEDYENGLNLFEKAVKLNSHYAKAYFMIGYCCNVLGRYTEAIEAYKQAIHIDPEYAVAYYNLGVIYSDLERNIEAMEAYKQAIRLNPDRAEAHNNLGSIYTKLDRHIEAMEAYKQAIRINPENALSHYNLGLTYTQLGRYTEAIGAYKQAIYINPDYTNAHYNLGLMYLIIGDNGAAFEEYKILKDLDKDLANKLFDLIYR